MATIKSEEELKQMKLLTDTCSNMGKVYELFHGACQAMEQEGVDDTFGFSSIERNFKQLMGPLIAWQKEIRKTQHTVPDTGPLF